MRATEVQSRKRSLVVREWHEAWVGSVCILFWCTTRTHLTGCSSCSSILPPPHPLPGISVDSTAAPSCANAEANPNSLVIKCGRCWAAAGCSIQEGYTVGGILRFPFFFSMPLANSFSISKQLCKLPYHRETFYSVLYILKMYLSRAIMALREL
jgi:hypothetical protein